MAVFAYVHMEEIDRIYRRAIAMSLIDKLLYKLTFTMKGLLMGWTD